MSKLKGKYLVLYKNGEADWWDTDQGAPSTKYYLADDVDDEIAELKALNADLHNQLVAERTSVLQLRREIEEWKERG